MLDAKIFENLVKTLQYEAHTYAGLLKLAEKKTDYLVKNDTESLSGITTEENKMIEQAGQLGKVREQYIARVREAFGLKSNANVEEIRKSLSGEQSDLLGKAQGRLREIVLKLAVRNGINQKLIENALNYIDFNLGLMTSSGPEIPVYGKSGQEMTGGRKRSMLDIKY